MNTKDLVQEGCKFCKLVCSETAEYYSKRVFLVISIGVFLILFTNTFFVYRWCHIDSETLLLSCGDHNLDTFFNYMTSHVLYQAMYNYGQLDDGYSFASFYNLFMSSVMSVLFITGFLTLSFSVFNIPWRLFTYIKENHSKTEQAGTTNSD